MLYKINIDMKLFQAVMIGLSIMLILPRIKMVLTNKPLWMLLLLVSAYSIFKLYTDVGEGTRMTVLQILEPPFVYAAFYSITCDNYEENELIKKMTKLFFIFYLFETGMAITERVLGTTILGWNDIEFSVEDSGASGFRSAALHGHPLYNALMVSISMAFILFSPLKIKYKMILWSMGYISILCFNTRGSIVGNALLLAFYIIYVLLFDNSISSRTKVRLVMFSSIMTIVGLFLFFNVGLGGRLAEMGLFDESSAQTRIDVWDIFDNYPLEYFLWGISMEKMQDVMLVTGIGVTENFWIDQALRLGVVFLFIYILAYYKLMKRITIDYPFVHKMFISGAFILIASTNNSLSSNGLALLCFLILLHLFNPPIISENIDDKYLET